LRKTLGRDHARLFWGAAIEAENHNGFPCPECESEMTQVCAPTEDKTPVVDVCKRCQCVWLSQRDIDALAAMPLPADPRQTLTVEDREKLALAQLELMKEQQKIEDRRQQYPDEWWKMLVAAFGVPVEISGHEVAGVPWVTWTTAALIFVVSVLAFPNLDSHVEEWGFVADDMFRHGGLTFLTPLFLHAGWFHLLGNLYFFLVFGDNVEASLGRLEFLALLIVATIAGTLLHAMLAPDPTIPCIGASGGISGLLIFYLLRFPHIRIGIFIWIYFYIRWVSLPAWIFLLLWVLFQGLGAAMQLFGGGNVSYLAHAGGAAAGLLFYLLVPKAQPA
jgi:membrane associated rhomboid family serine protease